MTFYWWSHWFWITLICYLTLPLVVVVHTYPSQDSSQEYNQPHPQSEQTKKPVTKLYQASTTLTWVTESTSSILARNTTADKTRLQTVDTTTTPSESKARNALNTADYYYYDDDNDEVSNKTEPIDLEDVEEEQQQFRADGKMNDMKRSAEQFSKTVDEDIAPNPMPTSATTTTTTVSTTAAIVKKNNYTNYTEQFSSSTNTSRTPQQHLTNASIKNFSDSDIMVASSSSSSYAPESVAASSVSMSTLTTGNVTALPHAPSTPKIVKTHNPAEWLSSMDEMVAAAISPPPIRVTTDVTDDKFPFTLENVHKSEDLRRDENEPRRRQSKGLSAEYKPGYINYSPESKNLLTRSASTTVNEYESEENNISSEALSVQRAYFMDVGAISAICFTVFGICCTVGTIGIVLYRRRFLNKPQALSEPDSSVYIDDSTMRVSDNSDEMYSLDNDSFLNSLEAMTIQNYWTDTVKHTKL